MLGYGKHSSVKHFSAVSTSLNETIVWITDNATFPDSNQYVLIAWAKRTGVGYCKDKKWYHEDGGGVECDVNAWAKLPCGPYSEVNDRIDHAAP